MTREQRQGTEWDEADEEEDTDRLGGSSHGLHLLVSDPHVARRLRSAPPRGEEEEEEEEGAGFGRARKGGGLIGSRGSGGEGQAVLKEKSSTTVSQ